MEEWLKWLIVGGSAVAVIVGSYLIYHKVKKAEFQDATLNVNADPAAANVPIPASTQTTENLQINAFADALNPIGEKKTELIQEIQLPHDTALITENGPLPAIVPTEIALPTPFYKICGIVRVNDYGVNMPFPISDLAKVQSDLSITLTNKEGKNIWTWYRWIYSPDGGKTLIQSPSGGNMYAISGNPIHLSLSQANLTKSPSGLFWGMWFGVGSENRGEFEVTINYTAI